MIFELNELQVLRSSLDTIDIKGSNAQYLAQLQIKLEKEISRITTEIENGPPEVQKEKKPTKPIKSS